MPKEEQTLIKESWFTASVPEDCLKYIPTPIRSNSVLPPLEDNPLVSVIIPNWNASEYVEKCLNALGETTYNPWELIFVDNGSADDSLDRARSLCPQARFICNETNLGFSIACNQGFHQANGSVVVFLNVDTEVEPNWLEPLVSAFQNDRSAALVGSRLLLPGGEKIQAEGGLFVANGLAIHPEYGQEASADAPPVESVLYSAGAALAARKDFLDYFGGFDEGFSPAYYEDTDLAIKAYRLGFKNLVARESRVVHHETYATKKSSPEYSYLYHRSRLRFVWLHFRFWEILATWLRVERSWYANVGKDLGKTPLRKAYLSFLLRLPKILIHRFLLSAKLRQVSKGLQKPENEK